MHKPYLYLLCFFVAFGLSNSLNEIENVFKGERTIASSCDEAVALILKDYFSPPAALPATLENTFEGLIWSNIKEPRDFEIFDEKKYFTFLEIYKNKPLDKISKIPQTLEEKMALIDSLQVANLPSLSNETAKLTRLKYKQLEKLFSKFNFDSNLSREFLMEFSSELYLILKGPPVSLLDYFRESQTELMSEHYLRILQESLMAHGLKKIVPNFPAQNDSKLMKTRILMKKISQYKIWRLLNLPYGLPAIDRPLISEQLLEKIIIDGFENHKKEFIIELRYLKLLDHYDRFRKIYSGISFSLLIYYLYQEILHQKETHEKEVKDAFMESLDKIDKALPKVEVKTEDEMKELQMKRVLKNFRDKYKEDPSADEYLQLHMKIFGH